MSDFPVVPGYQTLKLLGRGGMGRVYLAIQQSIGRRVAIKILHPGWGDQTAATRLRREAAIAGKFAHPNMVQVFDLLEHDGQPVIVMEYVEGRTLSAWVSSGEASDAQLFRWLAQVAEAVGVAHATGVLHRDVKASNILITDDGVAKLGDFGLAIAESSSITATGHAVGTPHHLAPELLAGCPASAASDAYALGVTAFQALSGRLPFTGDAPAAIAHQAANKDAPLIGTLRQDLPPSAMTCIDGLLNRQPEKRPSIAQARTAFVAAAASGSVTATSSIAGRDTRKRTTALNVVGGGLLVVGAIAGLLWFYWGVQPVPAQVLPITSSPSPITAPAPSPTDSATTTELSAKADVATSVVFSIILPEIRWWKGAAQVVVVAMPSGRALTAVKVLQWSDDGEKWIDNTPASIGPDPFSGAPLANVQIKLPPCQAGERIIYLRFLDLHGIPSASQRYVFVVPTDPRPQRINAELEKWDHLSEKQVRYRTFQPTELRLSYSDGFTWSEGLMVTWSLDSEILDQKATDRGEKLIRPSPWPTMGEHDIYLRIADGSGFQSSVYRLRIDLGASKDWQSGSLTKVPPKP